jgi:hypothetical protein
MINVVQGRGRMLALPKNRTSVDTVEDDIKFVGLVRETTVVVKDIGMFPATYARSDADGLRSRSVSYADGRRDRSEDWQ